MDFTNEELFPSLSDEPLADPVADETPEVEAQEDQGQPRDENGRFAPKAKADDEAPKAEAQATPPKAEDPAHVPSFRLREVNEKAEAAERRAQALEAQLALVMQRLAPQQPQQPVAPPDPFENPQGFVKQNIEQALTPVQQEIRSVREEFSRMYAIDKYGEEKVTEAFRSLDQAARSGDPEAVLAAQRVRQSNTPFQDLMKWHEQKSVLREVGSDPKAFFQKQLEASLADPEFKAALLKQLGAAPVQTSDKSSVINLPPRLSRAASAAAAMAEEGDLSNEALFKHALG